MEKVKIISNPYLRKNTFQIFKRSSGEWIDINAENNPNSKLISKELTEGFFPFKVNKIFDEIIREYGIGNERLELYFEGTKADYQELKQVCEKNSRYDHIELKPGKVYLLNAEEILPQIIDTFKELWPIIHQGEFKTKELTHHLDRFIDATNDVIPLCVMGNYSAGKSTFINALIGNEILPSGDEPVTAKIYKITQSADAEHAIITFSADHYPVTIHISSHSCSVDTQFNDSALLDELSKMLDEKQEESIVRKINCALSLINADKHVEISDLIEVNVAFSGGIWEESGMRFAILDTPGSNSASNVDHRGVLQKALNGMTNGLPVYVSEYDNLDSIDNENLYKVMCSMPELDDRFTMIVVNKADENDLPEEGHYSPEKAEEILNLAIPKKLYSIGIFFVSSILGLGSKTDGKFLDKHLSRIYRVHSSLFTDKEDAFYTTLYHYDILPGQLKETMVQDCEKTDHDLLYVNSGLYAIERQIQLFARKYSSYNKCQQSTGFLKGIIQIITEEMSELLEDRKTDRDDLLHLLDKEKQDLLTQIKVQSSQFYKEYLHEHELNLHDHALRILPTFSEEDLRKLESQFIKEKQGMLNYEEKNKEFDDSVSGLKNNFVKNVGGLFSKPGVESIKNFGNQFANDISKTIGTFGETQETKKEADREASEALLKKVTEDFQSSMTQMEQQLEETSQTYWKKRTRYLKLELMDIVADADTLPEQYRKDLNKIIMDFDNIEFEKYKEISFKMNDFNFAIQIGNIKLLESDRLNIKRLNAYCNEMFSKEMEEMYASFHSSHSESFLRWMDMLLIEIEKKIVQFNPELNEMQSKIDWESTQIESLREKLSVVKEKTDHIIQLLEWQINEEE